MTELWNWRIDRAAPVEVYPALAEALGRVVMPLAVADPARRCGILLKVARQRVARMRLQTCATIAACDVARTVNGPSFSQTPDKPGQQARTNSGSPRVAASTRRARGLKENTCPTMTSLSSPKPRRLGSRPRSLTRNCPNG